MKVFLISIFIISSSALAYHPDEAEAMSGIIEIDAIIGKHLRIDKECDAERKKNCIYRFKSCESEFSCQIIGRENGYRYSKVKKLGGEFQRFAISSSLSISGVLTDVLNSASLPSKIEQFIGEIIWAPHDIESVIMTLNNPQYDFLSLKIFIKRSVRFLEKAPNESSLVLHRAENFTHLIDYQKIVSNLSDIVESIE